MINSILSAEQPQLVVLNGDLITGENTFRENSSHYVDQIVAPLVERGLLWASTYGNHDSDYNLSRADIYAREKRYANSLTQDMVWGRNAGVSNYYLPVFSSDVRKTTPEVILWFFDSRGGNYYQEWASDGEKVTQPSWVDTSVSFSVLMITCAIKCGHRTPCVLESAIQKERRNINARATAHFYS